MQKKEEEEGEPEPSNRRVEKEEDEESDSEQEFPAKKEETTSEASKAEDNNKNIVPIEKKQARSFDDRHLPANTKFYIRLVANERNYKIQVINFHLKKLDGHVHQVRRPECSVHSDFCSENNTPYVSECNRSNQLLNVLDKGSKTYLEITTRKDAPNSCKHRSDSGFRCCQYVNTNKGICKSNSRRDDSPAFLNVEKDIDVVQQHDDIPVPPIKSKKK